MNLTKGQYTEIINDLITALIFYSDEEQWQDHIDELAIDEGCTAKGAIQSAEQKIRQFELDNLMEGLSCT